MDHQDVTLTRLESEAAETVGAMRELFKEFEKRIGEVISVQRVSATEARTEGAQALQHLQELARCSRNLVDQQRSVLARIEQEWQVRIDSNAQRAGEAQAKAFGRTSLKVCRVDLRTWRPRSRPRHNGWAGNRRCAGSWGSRWRFRSP